MRREEGKGEATRGFVDDEDEDDDDDEDEDDDDDDDDDDADDEEDNFIFGFLARHEEDADEQGRFDRSS